MYIYGDFQAVANTDVEKKRKKALDKLKEHALDNYAIASKGRDTDHVIVKGFVAHLTFFISQLFDNGSLVLN